MKKIIATEKARVVTYARPGRLKSNIYFGMDFPEIFPGEAEEFSLMGKGFFSFPGAQFMYLWAH
jgi:hypothetical protein